MTSPDRSLVSASQGGQRDVATTHTPASSVPQTPAIRVSAAPPAAPFIIPGDGKPVAARPLAPHARPRSRVMHLALVSISFCVALAIFYAASPLTVGASNKFGDFLAASNARALPTATPTATPTPLAVTQAGGYGGGSAPNPGTQAIINEIKSVFGPYAGGALNVARCESGFDPNAWNPISVMGSHAEGVFQILYPITWDGTSEARYSPYVADANIHAAYQIFSRDGDSFREWACQP